MENNWASSLPLLLVLPLAYTAMLLGGIGARGVGVALLWSIILLNAEIYLEYRGLRPPRSWLTMIGVAEAWILWSIDRDLAYLAALSTLILAWMRLEPGSTIILRRMDWRYPVGMGVAVTLGIMASGLGLVSVALLAPLWELLLARRNRGSGWIAGASLASATLYLGAPILALYAAASSAAKAFSSWEAGRLVALDMLLRAALMMGVQLWRPG